MPARLGRYELIRELGVGGMARVYLGRVQADGGFERLVAIKVLHDHLVNEHEFVAMFLDEARLAAQIRHPNVVSTSDVQFEEGKRYLVMDYIDGASLSSLLSKLAKANQRIPIGITLRITLDMLAGLHAAHDANGTDGQPIGLVHRDVSPHNLLVGRDGLARITDFGVARAESRLSSTRSGEIKGKLPYMAPEQIASMPVDRRADVYAAGLVLWEMLAGRRHFVADNQGALLHKILQDPFEPASAHNPEVTPEIEAVISKACVRELKSRYASCAEVADDLEEAAHKSNVRIATARAVASMMEKALGPVRAVEAGLASLKTSSLLSSAGPHSSLADDIPTMAAPEPSLAPPSTTAGTVALVSERETPKRGRAIGWAALGAGLLAVGTAGFFLVRAQGGSSSAASSTTAGVSTGVEKTAVASTTAGAPTASASTTTTATEPAVTSAAASSTPSVSAPARVTTGRGPAPSGAPTATTKTGRGSGADFLPGDL